MTLQYDSEFLVLSKHSLVKFLDEDLSSRLNELCEEMEYLFHEDDIRDDLRRNMIWEDYRKKAVAERATKLTNGHLTSSQTSLLVATHVELASPSSVAPPAPSDCTSISPKRRAPPAHLPIHQLVAKPSDAIDVIRPRAAHRGHGDSRTSGVSREWGHVEKEKEDQWEGKEGEDHTYQVFHLNINEHIDCREQTTWRQASRVSEPGAGTGGEGSRGPS
eukprot:767137-Hanusia_phi.AAC.9